MALKRESRQPDGELRIIGGEWRSRRLRFTPVRGLRPSPDAVRETVFNWLQFDIASARCLDLFAGSGAMGFEAASRGAARVTMVESHPTAARQIEANRELLGATDLIDVFPGTVERFLHGNSQAFDVVFMDPPFRGNLLRETCALLAECHPFSDDALLYVESASTEGALPIPLTWHIIRQKDRGAVRATLIQPNNPSHDR